jgi:hypothetical protein
MNWFRVPTFIAGRLHGDHVATENEAWADLLGRWHLGEDVSACAFAEATCWGKGRVLKFMPKVAEWATGAGADVPKRWRADRNADQDRTAQASNATENEPTQSETSGPETDRSANQDRTASRARSSSERDQTRGEETENNTSGVKPPESEIPNPEKWSNLFQATPAPAAAETSIPKPTTPPIGDRIETAIRTVYEAYRLTHPRKSPTVSPGDRKSIRAMLNDCGGTTAGRLDEATENAALLIEWVAHSEDTWARQIRADAPWPDGEVIRRDNLESLARHVEPRLEMAIAWRDRGRRTAAPVRAPTPSRPAPAPFVSIADLIRGKPDAPNTPTRSALVIDIEEAN